MPSWPFTAMFVCAPLWWLLGIMDFIWIPLAGAMVFFMARAGRAAAPQGFGLWLLFMLWAGCSAVSLVAVRQVFVFSYRLAIYAACTVLFLYVYNNRTILTDRFVTGVLTIWWLITVAGGYIALILPTAIFRTPMSYLLPRSLVANPWVNQMVVRRLSQYNPDSFFTANPRPSAPFLYTNNWGNVYSLLMPFVLVHLMRMERTKGYWLIWAAIPASFVPAFLTLNRGMFLGLGIAAVYISVRLVMLRNMRAIAALGLLAVLGVGVFQALPAGDRLEARSQGQSTEDRASLYLQAIDAVQDAPFFGYGGPISGEENRDPIGTQGQFWIVLVSFGIGATVLFIGWFLLAFILSTRRVDAVGLVANTVLIVGTIEFGYYGALPYGLPVMMIAAALALRGPEPLMSAPLRASLRGSRTRSAALEEPRL